MIQHRLKVRLRRHFLLAAGFAGAGALAVACGSNSDMGGGTAGTGGSAGSTAHAGSAGTPSSGTSAGNGGTTATPEAGAGGAAGITNFSVKRTDLDSDQTGSGQTDANLVNAWGIAINPGAELFWVASNHGGLVTVYDAAGAIKPLAPKVPPLTGTDPGAPTGQVFNAGTGFMADKFVVDTEDGQVLGWGGSGDFVQRAKKDGAIYKGLALVGTGAAQLLVATDFHDATVDLYGTDYTPVTKNGAFVDTSIPSAFAPFNVMPIGDKVYITYAKQDSAKEDDEPGPGNGYVSEFATDGTFTRTLISGGELDSPWAVALAPSNFGALAGTLLIGNFGGGAIHAYNAASGALVGQLTQPGGSPLFILGLWDLKVGPTGTPDLSNTLFFSAGPGGESHGVFGKLEVGN
ncbi:MAG TPA: TIGR03118 family protein [Polyangiaceae bacterium]|jgi:uncharacterized protein (TIGR03118 family)|nr:TIGR03118 family protein [Polyangiaceae bacterium]